MVAGFVLLNDVCECPALPLIQSYMKDAMNRGITVHLVLAENPPCLFESQFKQEVQTNNRLVIYDCWTNPNGWTTTTTTAEISGSFRSPDIAEIVESIVAEAETDRGPGLLDTDRAGSTAVLVFDSINRLLDYNTLSKMTSSITRLKDVSIIEGIYAVFHRDICDSSSTVAVLSRLATTSIRLMLTSPGVTVTTKSSWIRTDSITRQKSGKIVRKNELIRVDEDLNVQTRKMSDAEAFSGEQTAPDPAENLTFNLHLTEQEKAARSRITLPYELSQERKTSELGTGSDKVRSGQIFYEPDEVDDYDEEDPDDDLDI